MLHIKSRWVMGAHIKPDDNLGGSIAFAVERLSELSELPLEGEFTISPSLQLSEGSDRKVNWVQPPLDPTEALNEGREMFRVVLNYLRNYYKTEGGYAIGTPSAEHVKTIMTLVGEAAKKLDRYTALFHKHSSRSATDSQEYRRLQQFYQSRIAHQIDEGVLGKWLLALAQQNKPTVLPKLTSSMKLSAKSDHVFVDLEAIKKDLEYELFFIRKVDGSRFFHPRLLRNLKLICDFSARTQGEDPLGEIELWQDRYLQLTGEAILQSLGNKVDQFFSRALKCKESELVMLISKSLMALMLCSYSKNRIKDWPTKSCRDYFADFKYFLGEALRSHDYHKLITYPPNSSSGWRQSLLSMVHALCRSLYVSVTCYQSFLPDLESLLHKASYEENGENSAKGIELAEKLQNDYSVLSKLLRNHPGGAMGKILDSLEAGIRSFDPFTQGNLPNQLYTWMVGNSKIAMLHLPTPTSQEYVNKVSILEEFRGFLRSLNDAYTTGRHLLINLQDRTMWRDHQRCITLEGMANGEFKNCVAVATLAKETDFYDQLAPYDQDHKAADFIDHFLEQLKGESSGYYFDSEIRKELIDNFAPKAMKAIHQVFFGGRNILPQTGRCDFIEIFDQFLILKLIDLIKPNSVSLTCKDGVDVGSSANVLLYALLKMVQGESISDDDYRTIRMQLFAPSLLVRERVIQPERFQRMLSALKTMNLVSQEHGNQEFAKQLHTHFGSLYSEEIFKADNRLL